MLDRAARRIPRFFSRGEPRRWLAPAAGAALAALLFTTVASTQQAPRDKGRIFYVRQTTGDDSKDGLSPETAWRSISKLDAALGPGDTAYVGPGLYRDQILLATSGAEDRPIRIVADPRGEHTGDAPGPVVVTGAEPFDERLFKPLGPPGVFKVALPHHVPWVVEMDGDQFRYRGMPEIPPAEPYLDIVARMPGSFHFESGVLYIHTSDGKPPWEHEIELVRRTGGVSMTDRHFVTIEGFTFRHVLDSGIYLSRGCSNVIALNNTSFGNRQGIRVDRSTKVLIVGNTLFRNENSGLYFLRDSVDGWAFGNTLYENVKGLRWGAGCNGALAIDNRAYENSEAGISLEHVSGARLLRNQVVNNGEKQLYALYSSYHSEGNCFDLGPRGKLIADLHHYTFKTLGDYRRGAGQDLASREGACGPLPVKLDVRKLHQESVRYAEKGLKGGAGGQAGKGER